MGKVHMIESPLIPGVYAVETDVEYFYCDKCGSFDLESKDTPLAKPRVIIGTAGLAICVLSAVWFLIALVVRQSWFVSCIGGLLGMIAAFIGIPKTYVRCRKCGNREISDGNGRYFCEGDESVLDVPSERIIKRYHRSRIY